MDIVIIEDEKIAAERLKKIVSDVVPDANIKAVLGSVKESTKWLLNNTADLILLDIQLSDGLSFSIFDTVQADIPIIFTTAYNQYAIKAFELNSIDYLLKPVRKKDLAKGIEKYNKLKKAYSIDFEQVISALQGEKTEYKSRFLIKFGEKFKKIDVDDIAYLFAMDKTVFLKTFGKKSFPIDYTLDKLDEVLNPEKFFRINRKYIVNLESIASMTSLSRGRIMLELDPKTEKSDDAIVSIDRSNGFKEWLDS